MQNQKGLAHLALIFILLAGIGLGAYLVGQSTGFFPKAGFIPFRPVSGPISGPILPPPPSPQPPICQTTLKAAFPVIGCGDNRYRFVIYQCSDKFTGFDGSFTSCKSPEIWKQYAESYCNKRPFNGVCPTPTPTPIFISTITITSTNTFCDTNNLGRTYPALDINWTRPTTPNLSYYAIESATNSATPTDLVDEAPPGSSSFPGKKLFTRLVTNPKNAPRYYRVVAKDESGNILATSGWSAGITSATCP